MKPEPKIFGWALCLAVLVVCLLPGLALSEPWPGRTDDEIYDEIYDKPIGLTQPEVDSALLQPQSADPDLAAIEALMTEDEVADDPDAEDATASIELNDSGRPLVIGQALAEILKLKSTESCTDAVIEVDQTAAGSFCMTDGLTEYRVPSDQIEDEAVADEFVLVSLDLNSYRLSDRARDIVEQNIEMFTQRIPDRFSTYLARSTRYLTLMKRILKEEGIPEEMAYLPLIESGYSTRAYSRARAVGPWQFMKATGKRYGLKIDNWVDERRDPVKSTRAAARYLRDLYAMFDSWSLAMAAYNAGEGRILRALKKSKGEHYWDLLDTRHIKMETKYYVPKFIAARLIAEDPARYNLHDIQYQDDFAYEEATIKFPVTLDVIARCAGASVEDIKDLNPELVRWITPPTVSYTLRVPPGSKERFIAGLAKIPPDKRVTVTEHVIKRGDTLSHIARRYGVPMDSIIAYNKIRSVRGLRPGQSLIIPLDAKRS